MPKSPLSPSAMMLAGRMPVIAEDDSLPAVVHPSDAPGLPPPPPPPSRTTKPKTWARSPISRPIYPYPSYPPPAYNPSLSSSHHHHARNLSRSSSRSSSRSTVSTRSLMSSSSSGGGGGSRRSRGSPPGSRPGSGTSTPRSSYYKAGGGGARHSGLVPITTPVGPAEDDKSGEKAKEARRRRRRWNLILGMIVVVGLVVGLSVGLTIGSRKQTTTTTPQLPPNLPSIFPAGSFAFTTALTSAPTNCTANPSTWRCFPYTTYAQASGASSSPNASLATFFWTIAPRNAYTYQVSSSPNPFAPQFANLTTALLDGNSYDERLVFNFSLPKTVVPSAAVAAGDRAASCVWAGTAFIATLWTRRSASVGGGGGGGAPAANATVVSDGSRWAAWPGQVEVVQVASGGPECKDSEGAVVPVAAGDGECECRYANFGLGG